MPAQKLDKHSLKILNMEPSGVATNNSHQQLMSDTDSVEVCAEKDNRKSHMALRDIPLRQWVTVVVLCYVNLINYMDRFTVAGVLTDIQAYFGDSSGPLSDDKGGLLQTAFVLSYMLFAPLFGYLGDRYSRRYIMAAGVLLWSLTTLVGSFMTDFTSFIIFRGLVGIGEASYSTIAPTIISDMFVKDIRSKMLALFYFAIPVGSGLGYIVGSETAKFAGSWQWGLRVTPIMGAIAVILILAVMKDPARGESEGAHLEATAWCEDIKDLSRNASFMLSTFGFTCVAFVAGALAWWGPKFISLGIKLQGAPGEQDADPDDLSFMFGLITMLAGLFGLTLGVILSQGLKRRFPRCDPLICAGGLMVSAPLLTAATFVVTKNTPGCYTMLFLGQVALNLNWAIVADITLYVVIPTRRSTAEAFQILMSHALGDAGSPYLIGVVSEALKISFASSYSIDDLNTHHNLEPNQTVSSVSLHQRNEDHIQFTSLQYALFITSIVEVLGGCFFLLTAIYVIRDKLKVEKAVAGEMVQPRNIFADDSTEVDQRRNLVS